jgi:SagB-type dehydrogenase family enzyme
MHPGRESRPSARALAALPLCLFFVCLVAGPGCARAQDGTQEAIPEDLLPLPDPSLDGAVSVEQALHGRRSWRSYRPGTLSLDQVGQVLWAAQGVTHPWEEDRQAAVERYGRRALGLLRTAPSAGALYPIELYLVVGHVDGLEPAAYRYHPIDHALELVLDGDLRAPLQAAALGQAWVGTPPAVLVITGVVARTAAKYGSRAERYVQIEVGAVAQNVYLVSESLQLATVLVGAFTDDRVASVLELPEGEAAYAIMPIGIRREVDRAP